MNNLNRRFEREVYCSDEFAGPCPVVIVVVLSGAMIQGIKVLSQEVKRLKVLAILDFDCTPSWYEEGNAEDPDPPVLGELYTNLDCVRLNVTATDFWWIANINGTNVQLSTASISVGEL